MRTMLGAVLVVLAVIGLFSSVCGTEASRQFVQVLGDEPEDAAEDVIRVVENGVPYYVVTGWMDKDGLRTSHLIVAKYDTLGALQWRTVLGDTSTTTDPPKATAGRTLIEAYGGGYLVGGGTKAYGQGNADILLARVGTGGALVWARVYGGTARDDCECLLKTDESQKQYLVGGYTGSDEGGAGGDDFLVMEIDSLGNPLSGKTFTLGSSCNDYAWRVIRTEDAYAISGWTEYFSQQGSSLGNQAVVAKYDLDWDSLCWVKHFGGNNHDDGAPCIAEVSNGTAYIAAGGTRPGYFGGLQDAFFARIDAADGSLEWKKVFGTAGWDFCSSLIRRESDAHMIAGGWIGTGQQKDQHDFLLLEVDPDTGAFGDYWAVGDRTDSTCNDFGRSAVEAGKGFVVAGRTLSWGAGKTDLMIAKYDSLMVTCRGNSPDYSWVTLSWSAYDFSQYFSKHAWSDMETDSLGDIVLNRPEWADTTVCP